MESKDDVLKALLAPIVEELVTNAMSTYFTVNGFDAIVERVVKDLRRKEEAATNAAIKNTVLAHQMQLQQQIMQREKMRMEEARHRDMISGITDYMKSPKDKFGI